MSGGIILDALQYYAYLQMQLSVKKLLTIWFLISYIKQTPWLLVHKRTILTEQPPLVDEIYYQLLWIEGCRVVSAADPLRSLVSVF
jgi:hypothetical protein